MTPTFPNNVFLTGFMGVGKSTVGPILAEKLGWRFVDADSLLAREAGKSIPEIFAAEGEVGFRQRESHVLERVASQRQQVVALGGGVVTEAANRELLKKAGLVVYLVAKYETLLTRVQSQTGNPRPLFQTSGEKVEEQVKKLLATREPWYREATLHVDTEGKSPATVAAEIWSHISCAKP